MSFTGSYFMVIGTLVPLPESDRLAHIMASVKLKDLSSEVNREAMWIAEVIDVQKVYFS